MKHLLYTPFTGLGLYNGSRGNAWLKNRIQIFKQFVLPSLQAQTNKNFTLWISWRWQDKNNSLVKELKSYLDEIKEFKTIFTYSGVCFWDDKYSNDEARSRLLTALKDSTIELFNELGEVKEDILMTIQPSDDCYVLDMVEYIQNRFNESGIQAIGFSKGYITNYLTGEVKEYNPVTNPPFYTIKFPVEIFKDPLKHANYTALKKDVGKYKAGTPIPSHEYVGDALKYEQIHRRGFLVGCHSENISTNFSIPYAGKSVPKELLKDFGIYDQPLLKIKTSIWKRIYKKMPNKAQRKLRYWIGERFLSKIVNY